MTSQHGCTFLPLPSPPLPKLAKLICILFDGWMLQETCSTGTWLQFQTGVTLVALLLLSLGFDLLRKGLVCVLLHYQVCVRVRVCVYREAQQCISTLRKQYKKFNVYFMHVNKG